MQPIKPVFEQIALGLDLTKILPKADSKTNYFYMKAFKIVNPDRFASYCQQHKKSNPDFLEMLYTILDDHYPPLQYCHQQTDGYVGLDEYVDIAREVLA